MSIEAWENRYTVRKFSETNREINPEHLKYLETALNNLPVSYTHLTLPTIYSV